MKLIDYICERTGETKEYIVSIACPSIFGPEYDGCLLYTSDAADE